MPEETVKVPTFLFHPEHGQKLFKLDEDLAEELEEQGWVDSPAGFDVKKAPEKKPDNTSTELTKQQEEYLQVFLVKPEKLDKPELVELGKGFGVKLMPNYKEETMISKIKEALDDNG